MMIQTLKIFCLFALVGRLAIADDTAGSSLPKKYTLDYPVVDQCCPPVRSTFVEADRSFSVVRGRRFRHRPNGGYGLHAMHERVTQSGGELFVESAVGEGTTLTAILPVTQIDKDYG